MAIRAPHGNARHLGSGPRVEVLPADELPQGVLAPQVDPARPERDEHGRFVPGSSLAQRRGGRSKGRRARLCASLGLSDAESGAASPFLEMGAEFARQQLASLAEQVGGGEVPPDAQSLVQTASLQTGLSRYLMAKGLENDDDALLGQASRLANDARQNLLAARELTARAAHDRRDRRGPAPIVIPRRKDPT